MFFRSTDRQILARIREEIQDRLDSLASPEPIESFLLDHWALLLRDIYLSRGGEHPDWQAGWDTVDALIWSLTPKQSQEDTDRLLRLLPILLGRLKEGCAALGMPGQVADDLLKALAGRHANLARSGQQSAPPGLSETPSAPLESEAAGQSRSGGETPAPSAVSARTDKDAGTEAQETSSLVDALQLGAWVTIRGSEGEKQLCLQWISASGNMYLFADSQGLDALSLTRQRLQERVARGELFLRA